MEDLNKKRKEHGIKEKAQARFSADFERRKYQEFLTTYLEKNLDDIEFLHNINLVSHYLTKWSSNLKKDDSRNKPLNEMFRAILIIQSYQINLRAKLTRQLYENLKYQERERIFRKELEVLRAENKTLQKQVDYYDDKG